MGATGPAGRNALVSVAPEAAGTNCSDGGIVVRSGLDANGNGVLEPGEVTSTSYVCNGNGTSDTPAQVLAKLVTVDGNGSGLDADLLQGQTLSAVAVPAGTVVAYAGSTIPAGWLLCDGLAVSRTTYSALFSAIGIIHGLGDGVTTFNLPDYRGRFLRGVDGSAFRDPDRATRVAPIAGATGVGNAVGSIQGYASARPLSANFTTDTQGLHNHSNGSFSRLLQVSGGTNTSVTSTDVTASEPDLINSAPEVSAGSHAHTITGGGDNETRPLNAYIHYIIKT